MVTGSARAQVTDHDPSDRPGYGRGGGTGVTDSDSGPGADVAGRGRGGGPRPGATGYSDNDSGPNADIAGRGRGGSGITDSDSGPGADPAGRGRGGPRGATGNDGMDPAQREQRCQNNRERSAELSRDGDTPETWSQGQLQVAQADLAALEGASAMQDRNQSGDPEVAVRAWAIVEPIARRYGIPATRSGYWLLIADELRHRIRTAEYSPTRAERLRQLEMYRTNLIALGC